LGTEEDVEFRDAKVETSLVHEVENEVKLQSVTWIALFGKQFIDIKLIKKY
jgi:hypothetical protein